MNYKVIEILPLQSGVSTRGNWQSQQIIVESTEPVQYPDRLLLTFNGSHVEKLSGIQVGMEVTVNYSAQVRKYTNTEGKVFYNQELRCWKIEDSCAPVGAQAQSGATSSPTEVKTF